MNVTDNHFVSDFFHLNEESSCFEIAIELSFQDGEFIFNELSSGINSIIELTSHFLTVSTPDNLVLSGADRDNRIGMKIFPDDLMNRFRIVSFVHDVTIRLSGFVTLSEQFLGMWGIVDPTF